MSRRVASPERIEEVARLYVAAIERGEGPSVVAFAKAHGVGVSAVYRALHRHNTPPPRVGTHRPSVARRLADAPPLAELEDAFARWGFEGAAEEYEVTEERVREWLRAYGELSEGKAR